MPITLIIIAIFILILVLMYNSLVGKKESS